MPERAGTRAGKVGAPPGTLVHVGDDAELPTVVSVVRYGPQGVEELETQDAAACLPEDGFEGVTWVCVRGLGDVELIRAIGECFDLHPLVLEDILDTGHRPKVEDYEAYLYFVAHLFGSADDTLTAEQVSLVLLPAVVLSFEEAGGPDVFEPVRERIRNGKGRIRGMGADYLFYALIDAIVDSYFVALEETGARVEVLEDQVVEDPQPEVLRDIHRLKSRLTLLRKGTWPMRDAVSRLERGISDLITPATAPFLRDVYDHTIQVAESAETYREMLLAMLDTYLSSVSNRMNEVMKVLTIIATIFIPITFVAGIYGMNFKHMPELEWPWAYPMVLAVMAAVALGMVMFFRRRNWL